MAKWFELRASFTIVWTFPHIYHPIISLPKLLSIISFTMSGAKQINRPCRNCAVKICPKTHMSFHYSAFIRVSRSIFSTTVIYVGCSNGWNTLSLTIISPESLIDKWHVWLSAKITVNCIAIKYNTETLLQPAGVPQSLHFCRACSQ